MLSGYVEVVKEQKVFLRVQRPLTPNANTLPQKKRTPLRGILANTSENNLLKWEDPASSSLGRVQKNPQNYRYPSKEP